MKKTLTLTAAILTITATAAFAGNFTFGSTTYEQADGILIVNSLGDQVAESTYKNLGYNDYIPENAFKNNLAEQGYTVCFDSKPADVETVAVTYAGRLGDPRTEDVDYVLKSEYQALNAKEQDRRINELNNVVQEQDNVINELRIDAKQFRSRAFQAAACSAALVITTPSKVGKTTVTAEAATVGGESAVGVTVAHRLKTDNAATLNLGFSTSNDVQMVRAGISIEF